MLAFKSALRYVNSNMAEISIEIGSTGTEDLRYLGIQPPLDAKSGQYGAVIDALNENEINLGFKTRVPEEGFVYSFGTQMDVTGDIDSHIRATAQKIADILREGGNRVSVDEKIKYIAGGTHLFIANALADY